MTERSNEIVVSHGVPVIKGLVKASDFVKGFPRELDTTAILKVLGLTLNNW